MRKAMIILFVVAAVAAAAFFGVRAFLQQSSQQAVSQYNTTPAARGELATTVGAAGTLIAAQSADLSFSISGAIEKVNVQPGQAVKAGDVLMELGITSVSPQIIGTRAELLAAQNALAQLQDHDLVRAQSWQAVVNAEKALDDARHNLRNVENPVGQSLFDTVNDTKLALDNAATNLQLQQNGSLQAAVNNAQNQVNQAYSLLQDITAKNAECNGCLDTALSSAQTNYRNALGALTTAQLQLDNTLANQQDSVTKAKDKYDQAVANLDAAKRGPDALKLEVAQANLGVAEAQLASAQNTWDEVKDGPKASDVSAAQNRVEVAEATLAQTSLLAPFDGTVIAVNYQPGDLVTPGRAAVSISRLDPLFIDVQISEVDVNRLAVGQNAVITLDAVPGQTFEGEVSEIGLAGATVGGVVNFPVRVSVSNPDPALKAGMTAAVNVVTQKLSDVLLVPNRAVRVQDGQRVVFILKGNLPTPVKVELGLSNETMSEVKGGELNQGDAIILNPPANFDPNGPPPFVNRGG